VLVHAVFDFMPHFCSANLILLLEIRGVSEFHTGVIHIPMNEVSKHLNFDTPLVQN
jgi:hypothetical protein